MVEQSDPEPATTVVVHADLLALLHAQSRMLLSLGEQVGTLLSLLDRPREPDEPSLARLVADLVDAVKEQTETVERVDKRLTALGTHLPPVIANEIEKAQRNRDLRR